MQLSSPTAQDGLAFALTDPHDIVYPKNRARPQDATDLRAKLGFDLDIHTYVEHVGAVENTIGKWHRKRAAQMQRNAVLEPDPAAEYPSGLDVFGSEINSIDPAPVPAGR